MNQTLAIAERRNIVGVLSGPAARVAAWVKANPRRFIRGLSFQLSDKDTPSPAALRTMHAKGELQVRSGCYFRNSARNVGSPGGHFSAVLR